MLSTKRYVSPATFCEGRFPEPTDLQLDGSGFGLDDRAGFEEDIVKVIDWSLFQSKGAKNGTRSAGLASPLKPISLDPPPPDPTSLIELATKSRTTHIQRNQPSKAQCSEVSYLQSFVRDSKTSIIDPLFSYLRDDPLFIEAQMEAEAQVQLPLTVHSLHSVKTPQRCPVGTGRRRLPALRLVSNNAHHADNALVNPTFLGVDRDLPKRPRASDSPLTPTLTSCSPRVRAVGERRSSRKALRPSPPPPRMALSKPKDAEKTVQTACDRPKRYRGPKSDTFKMAWSVEEQRLLERLLEEIPDGEKNR